MRIKLRIWRQNGPNDQGKLVDYDLTDVSEHMSFLEMLDVLNEKIIEEGKEEPISFDYDCREGICGMCSLVINGVAHGPEQAITTCQTHMRSFKDGDTITVEPWKAGPFPVIKDLAVDRSSFDRIIQAGGYISINCGNAQDANNLLISKEKADMAFDAATCIGCGACVAACKNSSAMLFVSAKVSQMALLPQGQAERNRRVVKMVSQHDQEGFGSCTNTFECGAVCPKSIDVENIATLNREFLRASLFGREE